MWRKVALTWRHPEVPGRHAHRRELARSRAMIVMRGQGGSGGWWVLDEPELHLGEDVVVPGLAG